MKTEIFQVNDTFFYFKLTFVTNVIFDTITFDIEPGLL